MWGGVANFLGLPIALYIAAGSLIISIPATARWKLHTRTHFDLTPSMQWPAPPLNASLINSRGRVLVTIQYHVEAGNRALFLAAVEKLGKQRRRDGAYAWG